MKLMITEPIISEFGNMRWWAKLKRITNKLMKTNIRLNKKAELWQR